MGRNPVRYRNIALAAMAVCLSLAAAPSVARQPTSQSWELRGGQWQPVADANIPADPELDRVESLVNRRGGRGAFKAAVRWLKSNPQSPQRDRGLMLAARALYNAGDRFKSFYYCDELLDTVPASPYYQPALDLQFQIADEFLDGRKRKFLGLPLFDADDEAIEMLFRIQQRSPGSQIAERALLRTADFYFSNADYDLAGDAYAAYARSYPRSPELSSVRLQQALSYYAQFRSEKFDATPVIDARAQLVDLLQTDPQLAQQENVPALIERIDGSLAQKLNTTAEYYRRVGKPHSAVYLYEQVVKNYPNTPEADVARGALERLPAAEPPPDAPPAEGTDAPAPSASARPIR